jgi:predicted phosphodiesterase
MGIFCIGDIHGKFNLLAERVREIPPRSHLLCVGDIGVGFEDSAEPSCLNLVNTVAQQRGTFVWMIRGNHDNPYCFRGHQQYWNNANSNIKLMADVDSIELEGNHIIFVGGAISVDRSHEGRIDGYSWWKEEPVHESCPSRVYHIVEEFGPADLLITHAGPITTLPVIDEFEPNIYHYSAYDPNLLHDINEERTRLSDCVHYSRSPMVVYGHYHVPLEYHNTGVDYRCVAELEVWEFLSKKTAHLPKTTISDEEKAKVQTAPIRLKAPLKVVPQPNTAIARANTEDATTEELIAKTKVLRDTSKHTVAAASSGVKQLPPLNLSESVNLYNETNNQTNNQTSKKQLPPLL